MQIHLLIFQTSIVECFSCLVLDYYLCTCCGRPSFVLAYLCGRYFWGLIIIFVGCNLDFEQNGPFTLQQQPLGHVPSIKSSLDFDSPNIMRARKNAPNARQSKNIYVQYIKVVLGKVQHLHNKNKMFGLHNWVFLFSLIYPCM